MNVPTPIENLPGFNSEGISQPGPNPWLKYIIIIGFLLAAIALSNSLIRKSQENIIRIKPEENKNGKD